MFNLFADSVSKKVLNDIRTDEKQNEKKWKKEEIQRVLAYKKIKIFWIWTERIGEFIFMSMEIIRDLEKYERRGILPVFIPLSGNLRNTNLSILAGFSREFTIVYEPNLKMWEYIFRNHAKRLDFSNIDYYTKHIGNQQFLRMYPVERNSPVIRMTTQEQMIARKMVDRMNLKDQYVCFAGRDQAYLRSINPERDIAHHECRNCSLEDYSKSILYLNEQGISGVLVGKKYEENNRLSGVEFVDYSGKFYNQLLDWYLLQNCKFYFGDSGGVSQIAQMLGTPIIHTNLIPHPMMILRRICKAEDLCIFKKLWSEDKGRFLNLKEVWDLEQCKVRDAYFYRQRRIRVVDNTPNEIMDVVREMNERLNGIWRETEEYKANWEKYLVLFEQWVKDNGKEHFEDYPVRIGSKFLKDNEFLLNV